MMALEPACLITNEKAVLSALSACSIIGQCRVKELEDLRPVWGVEARYGEMPETMIILRKDWNATFRDQHWTLVPVKDMLTDIILQLLECKATGVYRPWNEICNPAITFRYELVSFKLGDLDILRSRSNPRGADLFSPPYAQFPNLTSRPLHPYFVILSAWTAFRANEKTLGPRHIETYGLLRTIIDLWYERREELPHDDEDEDEEEGDLDLDLGEAPAGSDSSDTLVDKPGAAEKLDPALDKRAAPAEPVERSNKKRKSNGRYSRTK
ncbi:hypothetical protein EVG20_g10408 [Dentipellis fragilis]|uniref:HNH nuclease domain-containing protein n=1 Tax=Dentipellis fragilis TaxID=205917 RepID=A0A4Y9XRS2_9AGAM|nr:hypothetical protein EVG20_g10408 [Dentipellis fragilis]